MIHITSDWVSKEMQLRCKLRKPWIGKKPDICQMKIVNSGQANINEFIKRILYFQVMKIEKHTILMDGILIRSIP